MNFVIDIGNTQVKAAVFELDKLLGDFVFEEKELSKKVNEIASSYPIHNCILSSVKGTNKEMIALLQQFSVFIELSSSTKVSFKSLYTTPSTLGIDRIALVAAASAQFPKKNVLIIDAGTCITYDLLTAQNEHLGGAISPGVLMRYKSLNYYTSKLPELSISQYFSLVGDSTESSIHSGVINGVIHEINGVVNQYIEKFEDLTVVLTGGDTKFLSKQLKNSIFATQNFLLYGLNEILTFNIQE